MLKLLQSLEAAAAAAATACSADASGAGTAHAALAARLDAAAAGGVPYSSMVQPRALLARLAALQARHLLEAALHIHGEAPAAERVAALRDALDAAEGVYGMPFAAADAAESQDTRCSTAADAASVVGGDCTASSVVHIGCTAGSKQDHHAAAQLDAALVVDQADAATVTAEHTAKSAAVPRSKQEEEEAAALAAVMRHARERLQVAQQELQAQELARAQQEQAKREQREVRQ